MQRDSSKRQAIRVRLFLDAVAWSNSSIYNYINTSAQCKQRHTAKYVPDRALPNSESSVLCPLISIALLNSAQTKFGQTQKGSQSDYR